ncbi:MAG TPA: AAA family ATPase [Polyangiaceae bacterium]|nr:AAA family ATPase [Polyangiaceae bacterium]
MRFQRLDFGAFGPFTGLSLDLSGGAPGGFHIVFGPNEAGKSSALRGVHDFLFGFPERTPDAHVHPNAELRISAALTAEAGHVIELKRLKRRKDALRDAADAPIDEGVMSSLLGGVDAQLFERLFGLDHERLRRAGEALLEDQGDVGESLFDAGSGGRGIRSVLASLEQGADEIFRPRSSKASLNVLLEAYKEAKSATRDALVSPEKWLAQAEQLKAARSRLEELGERRKQLREESNAQSRLDAVLGPIAQRNALRDKLIALGPLPLLAEDAGERRVRAERTLDEAQHERARLEREIKKKQDRLAELVVPENLLGVSAEAIEKLRDRVGKFRAAEEDLPRRHEDARRHEAELSRLVNLLYPGQPLDGLEALRPSQTELSRVRKLPQRQAALLERVANVHKALRGLAVQRAQTAAILADLPAPRELGVQRRVLSLARAQGDVERRAREALSLADKLELSAKTKLSALGAWRGSLDALPGLEVPSEETIDRFQRELTERAQRLAELERDRGSLSQRLAQTVQRIKAIEGSGSVPSEAALDSARARRDDGLRRVLGAWSRGDAADSIDREYSPELPLADSLERAVKAADEHADRLRREAERVSSLAALTAEREQLSADLAALEAGRVSLGEQLASSERAWVAVWRASNIEPATPPEMRAWLSRQRLLAELAQRAQDARLEAVNAGRERDALCAELAYALGQPATPERSLGAMLAACEDAVEAGTRAADRRLELLETLREIDRQQAEREQDLAIESEALEAWQVEWSAATAKLGFAGELSPDEVVTRLDSLSGLFDGLVQLSDQRRRATRIEEDRAKFQTHVSEWIQTYAPDLAPRAPDVAAEELVRRFQAAEHQSAESSQIQADLAEVTRALSALEARRELAESELESLRAAARAPDLGALPGIEARVAEGRGLQRQLDAVEGSLLKDEGVPLEALVDAARGVDRAALQVRLRELEEELERLDEEHQNLSAQVRDLEHGLERYAETDAADYAQGLSVQAAEIREQALRYARLKLSSVVLQREVERYREQNQGPVLKRASALFPRLTLGSFRGLRVGVEERQIVALREDGKELSVDGLSEGTRYQLYLALRIASLERYLERNPPLPLVLDDILIHFDDERAAAALSVLGELAERIQILFFTHHARDLALAASAIPARVLFRHGLSGPLLKSI